MSHTCGRRRIKLKIPPTCNQNVMWRTTKSQFRAEWRNERGFLLVNNTNGEIKLKIMIIISMSKSVYNTLQTLTTIWMIIKFTGLLYSITIIFNKLMRLEHTGTTHDRRAHDLWGLTTGETVSYKTYIIKN